MKLGFTRLIAAGALAGTAFAAVGGHDVAVAAECAPPVTPSTTSTPTTGDPGPLPSADSVRFVVTGAGPGGGPHVNIFHGAAVPSGFFAYAAEFTGGVFVAAGDVNGDGHDDIVTSAGPGGGPHVKIYGVTPAESGPRLAEIGGFYAYEPQFTGGVHVAVADVNGDGKGDIVTGPGAGGGPHVRVFSGASVLGPTPTLNVIREFMAYTPAFSGGVTVAAAPLSGGDDAAEIVTGAGPGGGPHVRVFNAAGTEVAGVMPFPQEFAGGVNVAAACVDGVARIAVATATEVSGVVLLDPKNVSEVPGGFFYDTEEEPAAFEGLGVALGSLEPDADPAMQLVTAFSDEPQIVVSPAGEGDELAAFNAYGVPIRISLAVGKYLLGEAG